MAQPTAYIVDALRTAGGRRNGKLAGWHPPTWAGRCSTRSSRAAALIRS